ncbi:helix-turn-helix domain-containing protein [Mycobacteroides chelonae]|uniref:helix-turn-helix domain-containing protein n=1 Tax=Mycobacteroides chelonae TaxID=1774 RepID=UPI00320473CD
MDLDIAVGRRVEALRIDAGLSQGELSDRLRQAGLNWSQGTVSRVETGDRPVRFVEALTLAGVLRVDLVNLTPSGGGLTFAYQRHVQVLEEARWAQNQAAHNLNTADSTARLLRLALELSQGSRRDYTLRIAPHKFLSHLGYLLGPWFPFPDLFGLLGADAELISQRFEQVTQDVASGFEPIPDYAPRGFAELMECYDDAEPGTDAYAEKISEGSYLLEQGMVDRLFVDCFPNVQLEVSPNEPATLIDWPRPVVEGIETADLEQPLRRPPIVRGVNLGR